MVTMVDAQELRPEEERLLKDLAEALHHAPKPVKEIEVGIGLSIALGRLRPAVACGGCSTPLEFEGIPAKTTPSLKGPFRLVFDSPTAAT